MVVYTNLTDSHDSTDLYVSIFWGNDWSIVAFHVYIKLIEGRRSQANLHCTLNYIHYASAVFTNDCVHQRERDTS